MVERSKDWMKQAERDLQNAKYEMKGGYYEWACFLCQQAAEKAIKAVFQKLGGEAFGHSVSGLLSSLPQGYKVKKELMNKAKELDKAYIPTRYPNSIPEGAPFEVYTEDEARRMISYAEEIVRFCKGILSKTQ
jgi:HEPN domain-containing protein